MRYSDLGPLDMGIATMLMGLQGLLPVRLSVVLSNMVLLAGVGLPCLIWWCEVSNDYTMGLAVVQGG